MKKKNPTPIHELINNKKQNTNLMKLKKRAFFISKLNQEIKNLIPNNMHKCYTITKIHKYIIIIEINNINYQIYLNKYKKKIIKKLRITILPLLIKINILLNLKIKN